MHHKISKQPIIPLPKQCEGHQYFMPKHDGWQYYGGTVVSRDHVLALVGEEKRLQIVAKRNIVGWRRGSINGAAALRIGEAQS